MSLSIEPRFGGVASVFAGQRSVTGAEALDMRIGGPHRHFGRGSRPALLKELEERNHPCKPAATGFSTGLQRVFWLARLLFLQWPVLYRGVDF